MRPIRYILILLFALVTVAFGTALIPEKGDHFLLVSKSTTFEAGDLIELEFSSNSKAEKPQLFIIHSYGKTLLEPSVEKGNYIFKIPANYCQKTGEVSWFLINQNKSSASGRFQITPNSTKNTKIENYLGPRSILAGGKEFTMMVTVPTDGLDNPVADNTTTLIKHQFLNKVTTTTEKTKNFFAWKNIFSENKSGKLLVSTECNSIATKEIETEVYPNIATNFLLAATRNHDFADGNQITTFTTSIIKDAFGNVVSDGTMVTFIILTKKQALLKTFGTTIGGIANGRFLHPDHEETFKVKAFITGMAESNDISLSYKPLLRSFEYSFTNKNRTLTVGPLKSFMNQLVPDGIRVKLAVYHGTKLIANLQEETSRGNATFHFSSDFYKEKNYQFEISTLGVIKTTEIKNYDLTK